MSVSDTVWQLVPCAHEDKSCWTKEVKLLYRALTNSDIIDILLSRAINVSTLGVESSPCSQGTVNISHLLYKLPSFTSSRFLKTDH